MVGGEGLGSTVGLLLLDQPVHLLHAELEELSFHHLPGGEFCRVFRGDRPHGRAVDGGDLGRTEEENLIADKINFIIYRIYSNSTHSRIKSRRLYFEGFYICHLIVRAFE